MSITLSALQKQRRDTAANWTGANPTLLAGEIGIESDTNKIKIGDGSTAWTSLSYRPWSQISAYPIVNADVAAAAAIAYSKLATLTSGNIVLGSSANVATSTAVTGDVTIGNTGVTAIAAGVIVNADINASAAIVDTKLDTIATALKVSNSATTATSANTASAIVARDASGNFTAGTITAALTGNATTVTTNANLTGDVTSTGNATAIAAGVIINADINASAAIAGTKIAPNFGAQNIITTGNVILNSQGDVRFADSDSSHYVGFQAPATVATSLTWTLPNADAAISGYALVSNASGTLSWAAAGGGATGGSTDKVFFENDQTVTTSYTLTASKNAMTAGPVTINASVTVTVPSGASWVVV